MDIQTWVEMLAMPVSATYLGSHALLFVQSSGHAFSVCVGVFTYNGLLYLQLDQRQIFRGPEQEKQHNRLDKKHSDKHSM